MYLVTGATGNVGNLIVSQLLAAGHSVRAYVRDPAKLAQWADRVDVVAGDYDTPDAFAQALSGASGVFLMNIGDSNAFARLVEHIAAHRTPRVVFQSSLMAGYMPDELLGRLHREKEELIRAAGLDCRILRPGGFMSNTYSWIAGIKSRGVVENPLGAGRAPLIAPEDIAAVAVRALTDSSFDEEVLTLTGGEAISVPEQVAVLAEALGKRLLCIDISLEKAVQNLTQTGIPAPIAASIAKAYESVRDGGGVMATDTVERVTGRRPMRFEEWTRAHIERFA